MTGTHARGSLSTVFPIRIQLQRLLTESSLTMPGNARPASGDSDGMIRRDPVHLEGCWRKRLRSVRRLSMGSVYLARKASSSMERTVKS